MRAIFRCGLKYGLAIVVLGLAIPAVVLAQELAGEGSWGSDVAQNEVSLVASPGQVVSAWTGLSVERDESGWTGDNDELDVDEEATTLPTPHWVSYVAFGLPSLWQGEKDFRWKIREISFEAPSLPGKYQYVVKWAALAAGQTLLVNLTVR